MLPSHPPLQLHPDKGGDALAFAQLKSAFDTVSDPLKLQQWQRGHGGGVAAVDTVDIEAMAYDASARRFTWPCRCGDVFHAPEHMLDLRCVAAAAPCVTSVLLLPSGTTRSSAPPAPPPCASSL